MKDGYLFFFHRDPNATAMSTTQELYVYTDASVCNNTNLAVIGFWILRPNPLVQLLPIHVTSVEKNTTSNDAEIRAAVKALETVEKFLGCEKDVAVHLYSDCQAVCARFSRSKQLLDLKQRLNVTVHKMKGHMARKEMTCPHQQAFSKVDEKTRSKLRKLRKLLPCSV